jgi:hypothetical protein
MGLKDRSTLRFNPGGDSPDRKLHSTRFLQDCAILSGFRRQARFKRLNGGGIGVEKVQNRYFEERDVKPRQERATKWVTTARRKRESTGHDDPR